MMRPRRHQFPPTYDEIFNRYLRPAIQQGRFPSENTPVIERDIYGPEQNKEPWTLFNQPEIWVFTKLEKTGNKILRAAGSGFWRRTSKIKKPKKDGRVLGVDKPFQFVCNNEELSRGKGHWVMREFSLEQQGMDGYALCWIRNKNAMPSLMVIPGTRRPMQQRLN